MEPQSKFSLNNTVYAIAQRMEQKFIVCAECGGEGWATFANGKKTRCSKCFGDKGSHKNVAMKWIIEARLTIGQIRIVLTNIVSDGMFDNVGHYEEGKTEQKVEYMAYETGIGSGRVHYEENLFATEEEAQAECDRRNAEKAA
jgi:hypothetical protein